MNKKPTCVALLMTLALATFAAAQDVRGFVITLKNGSSVRGRTLQRDETTGSLRLTMSETADGTPRSYAVIAMEDAETIGASSADGESIVIRLLGGSELRCKELGLAGDTLNVKIGTASRIEVRWDQIESITFGR